MDKNYLDVNNLKVSKELFEFVNDELLENTGIKTEVFGLDLMKLFTTAKNKELLKYVKIYKKLMIGISRKKGMKLKLVVRIFKRNRIFNK